MKKTFIFFALLIILNVICEAIIRLALSDTFRFGGIMNYFVILFISFVYYLGSIPDKRFLRLYMIPSIIIVPSIAMIIMDQLPNESLEGMSLMIFLFSSILNSFNELINILISTIEDNSLRKICFYLFNSIGISLFIHFISLLTEKLEKRITINLHRNEI